MRRIAPFLLAALALTACGKSPTSATTPSRGLESSVGGSAPSPAPAQAVPGLPAGAPDPRVTQTLALVQKLRDTSSTADSTVMFHYVKDDGSTVWIKSEYKYQKPRKNAVTLIEGSDAKATGTELIWTGDGQAQVHTKFIGFWLTIGLDLTDDRIKDATGYKLNETAVDKVFDTILCPRNQVSFLADGNLNGKPMTVLNIVSPLSLKGCTREVFGIDKGDGTPLLREMYKGTKLYYKLEVQSRKTSPHLTSADFTIQ